MVQTQDQQVSEFSLLHSALHPAHPGPDEEDGHDNDDPEDADQGFDPYWGFGGGDISDLEEDLYDRDWDK